MQSVQNLSKKNVMMIWIECIIQDAMIEKRKKIIVDRHHLKNDRHHLKARCSLAKHRNK